MSSGDLISIRIGFTGLKDTTKQAIRRFLNQGIIDKTLTPTGNHKTRAPIDEREDFRVRFSDSLISITAPANDKHPKVRMDCKVVNMSVGGFMVETSNSMGLETGEQVSFSLNFIDKRQVFTGEILGFLPEAS